MKHVTRMTGLLLAAALMLAGCGQELPVISNSDDAAHARIGVTMGSTGEAVIKQRFPEAVAQTFADPMDSVAAMKAGQIDAIVMPYPAAYQIVKHNPDLVVLPEQLSKEDSAIAVRQGNPELLASVNGFIRELQADGTLADMKRRWIKQDLSPYEELQIAVPTQGVPLRVGVTATRDPTSFVDATGRITGHDGELARRLAARLGRPLEFLDTKWMALIPALQSGKIDLIVSGMTATDERRKFVDFSEVYFANAQVLLVRKPGAVAVAATPKLATLADLKDKRLGVQQGTVYDGYAIKTYPDAKVSQFEGLADLSLAISSGKVDAGFSDELSLAEVMRENPQLGILGQPLFSSSVGVGFNKSRSDLREAFNRYLADIRKSGVYAEMVDRWVTQRATKGPDVAVANPNGVLKVGLNTGGMPFTGNLNNELVGFDVEMMRRFAASLGKAPEFHDMAFGSLVAAVASGKVDLIASSIFITEERKQRIDFSDSYFEQASVAFALKSSLAGNEAAAPAAAKASFLTRVRNSFYSNIILEQRYLLLWDGLKATAVISVLATLFGTALGALVCFMRMSPLAVLQVPAKVYIGILRGMPVVVLLMLIYYVVFASVDISPLLVAVVAFGMNFAAHVCEMFRTGIEGVDKGQSEAGAAMGFTKTQTFGFIVLPQMIQRILPVYKGEFISLVKMTSIVGYIAVQDLTKASDIIRSRTFDAFFPLVMVAVLYFLISWFLMQALNHLERVTDPKYRRNKAGAR